MPYIWVHYDRHCHLVFICHYDAGIADSRTLKAEIGVFMFSWILRTFLHKIVFWGDKIGKGWCDVDPPTNSFLLVVVVTSVPLFAKIDHEMRPWECRQRNTRCDRDKTVETRWLYCVECPQYSIRLEALGCLCDVELSCNVFFKINDLHISTFVPATWKERHVLPETKHWNSCWHGC